ncbi:MAG: ABC transporter ATP-binding protein [Candidatus Mcinerneyibacterium aminivorans]|jgi:ATP-binding cassette subfamily B protein/subfamily B ATP-binding cassette protein MsbA|uniref:ABC transporter ATP-binding protein n=1 Tax=Candidatus Mcinerneyibacterium aminivorans TaxID=2703815 RepID=A0A5D0MH00_9BACT|nr:MAG: ABC transporter ATP-binding protein [Candidatus Mcinerneyibacterium aminivorans]
MDKELPKKVIKHIKYFAKKYKKEVTLISLLLVLTSIPMIIRPLILRKIIDKGLMRSGNIQVLVIGVSLFIFLSILVSLFNYFKGVLIGILDNKIVLEMETKLYKKFQYADPKIYEKWDRGYIKSRIENDISSFASLFVSSIVSIIMDILILLVAITIIFILNWKLALISIILYPIYIVILKKYNNKLKRVKKEYQEIHAKTDSQIFNQIELLKDYKKLSRLSHGVLKYFSQTKKLVKKNIELIKVENANINWLKLLSGLSPSIMFLFGGILVLKGHLTLGTLMAFNSYLGFIYTPTSKLLMYNIQVQKALVAWKRIKYILNLPEEKSEGVKIDNIKKIIVKNLTYDYNDNENKLFKGLNYTFRKNKIYGIYGPSGIGKTTLSEILIGLKKDYEGNIMINETNLTKINIIKYRSNIRILDQEPLLFKDSILNNIKIGQKRAKKEKVVKISKQLGIHSFIKEFNKGYETVLSEKGSSISIGQKQRIAMARALISKPDLLILDEPFSNVDDKNMNKILNLLNKIKNKIIIIISHNKNILKICDKIYEIN